MKRLLLQKIGTTETHFVEALSTAEFKQLKGSLSLIPLLLPTVPRDHCSGGLKYVLE